MSLNDPKTESSAHFFARLLGELYFSQMVISSVMKFHTSVFCFELLYGKGMNMTRTQCSQHRSSLFDRAAVASP